MAPRRGGGRSSSGGGGLPSCGILAFDEEFPKINVAFHALFFVTFGVLLCFAGFAFLRSKQKSTALRRWWTLGVSIVLATLYMLLNIVTDVLNECGGFEGTIGIVLAASWMVGISNFLLLVAIVVPMSKSVLRAAQKTEKLVTFIFLPYVAVLVILHLAAWSIDTYSYHYLHFANNFPNERDKYDELVVHQMRFWTAICALRVLVVIMAAVAVAFAFLKGVKIPSRGVKIFIPLAVLSLLALILTQLGSYVDRNYGSISRRTSSTSDGIPEIEKLILVDTFLQGFFYACAFLFAILSARSLDRVTEGGSGAAQQFGGYPVQYDDPQPPKFDSVSQPQPYQQNLPPYTSYQYPLPQPQYQQPPQAPYQQPPQATYP